MSFNPLDLEGSAVATEITNWQGGDYKEGFPELSHDFSQLSLVLPDDCLLVFGPPRLTTASAAATNFYPVGYSTSVNIQNTRQVQPLKTIGSRRHLFAATNQPVTASIDRALFLGPNLLHAIYANMDKPSNISNGNRNSKYSMPTDDSKGTAWYTNIEEDLFRIPFGLGILYNSPASMVGQKFKATEYLEVCVLQANSKQIQGGQAVVMEQVTLMADRVIPWEAYSNALTSTTPVTETM